MAYSICPACSHKVDVGEDPDIGLHVYCDTCHADLVVAWLNPIELMTIDYEDYYEVEGDSFSETFQKIKKKKGDQYGSWKRQEKQQENNRFKKDY